VAPELAPAPGAEPDAAEAGPQRREVQLASDAQTAAVSAARDSWYVETDERQAISVACRSLIPRGADKGRAKARGAEVGINKARCRWWWSCTWYRQTPSRAQCANSAMRDDGGPRLFGVAIDGRPRRRLLHKMTNICSLGSGEAWTAQCGWGEVLVVTGRVYCDEEGRRGDHC
jgi:hypothetical protein